MFPSCKKERTLWYQALVLKLIKLNCPLTTTTDVRDVAIIVGAPFCTAHKDATHDEESAIADYNCFENDADKQIHDNG
jgi:hypothetical protein